MTHGTTTGYSSSSRQKPGGFAIGLILFAAIMLVLGGTFQAISGLVALFENEFYVKTPNYVFQFDATTWGWIHLLVGAGVVVAGLAVMRGSIVGRIVGIAVAGVSALANFAFIPYYPFWSLMIIALDVLVIWALAVHGGEIRDEV